MVGQWDKAAKFETVPPKVGRLQCMSQSDPTAECMPIKALSAMVVEHE